MVEVVVAVVVEGGESPPQSLEFYYFKEQSQRGFLTHARRREVGVQQHLQLVTQLLPRQQLLQTSLSLVKNVLKK